MLFVINSEQMLFMGSTDFLDENEVCRSLLDSGYNVVYFSDYFSTSLEKIIICRKFFVFKLSVSKKTSGSQFDAFLCKYDSYLSRHGGCSKAYIFYFESEFINIR